MVNFRLALTGFAKAVRETWPRTRVQRCTFHAFSQVKRYTTTRPRLQAGRELYAIARDLMGIEALHQAELWVERYNWDRPHSACGGLPPMSRIVGVNNVLAHNS